MIKIITLSLVFLISGCAGLKGYQTPVIGDGTFKVNSNSKKIVYYKVSYDSDISIENAQELEFVDAMKKSGCCVLTKDSNNSDVQVRIVIRRNESAAAIIPAIITGLSVFIIPSWVTHEYSFDAMVIDENKKVHDYKNSDSWVYYAWFPLIFIFPFALPGEAEEQTLRRMHIYLVHTLHNDGII